MQLAPVRRSSNQVTKGDCNLLCGAEEAGFSDLGSHHPDTQQNLSSREQPNRMNSTLR